MSELKISVINGPNLNMLGKRAPEVYGNMTLDEICQEMTSCANEKNIALEFFQSNAEGEIIDRIHRSGEGFDGIIINAGAYSHTSIAIRDAIESVMTPAIEVHLSNVFGREGFRQRSHVSPVCEGSIVGLGYFAYILALEYFVLKKGV